MLLEIISINKERESITIQNGPKGRDGILEIFIRASCGGLRPGDVIVGERGAMDTDRMVIGFTSSYEDKKDDDPFYFIWAVSRPYYGGKKILIGSINKDMVNLKYVKIKKAEQAINIEKLEEEIRKFGNKKMGTE